MVAARKRSDLIVSRQPDGRVVVKDPTDGEMYSLGEQEAFLLDSLDGTRSHDDVCRAFESRFGEPLTVDEIDGFAQMAADQGLALPVPQNETTDALAEEAQPAVDDRQFSHSSRQTERPATSEPPRDSQPESFRITNLLYWRRKLFNPDRLLSLLAPCVGFAWTAPFVVGVLGLAAVSLVISLLHGPQILSATFELFRWHSVVPVWCLFGGVVALHELAHGLTCKRFGGEVRECGFLLMLGMPCVYVDVSDAWMFPQKSRRIWVSLAGGFCELLLWSVAVLAWRLTVPGSSANTVALLLLTVTGVRSLFNFMPLIKLDGYYVLSDALGIPNLFEKSRESLFAHLRWLLWGASRPERHQHRRILLSYGLASWGFTTLVVGLLIYSFAVSVSGYLGMWGAAAVAGLGTLLFRGMFRGVLGDDFGRMLQARPLRRTIWFASLACAGMFIGTVPVTDTVSGQVTLLPASRFEVRAPVAGFLDSTAAHEGDQLNAGALVCQLRVPALEHRIATKQAELSERRALLSKLQAGARPEEIEEQERTVERAEGDLRQAEDALRRAELAHASQMQSFAAQLRDLRSQRETASLELKRIKGLLDTNATTVSRYETELQEFNSLDQRIAQLQAESTAVEHLAVTKETALFREKQRQADDARSKLRLLQLPTRDQDIAAAQAGVERLEAELAELHATQKSLTITAPEAGVVTTPRFGLTTGTWFETGELICEIEATQSLLSEIEVPEVHSQELSVGQEVILRLNGRADTEFHSVVASIGARIDATDYRSHHIVRCSVTNGDLSLHPGMTGSARIETAERTLLQIVLDRTRKLLRSEFRW